MKSGIILGFAIIIAVISIVSCKKNNEEETKTTSYLTYKNQDLQGVIHDMPWKYATGYVYSMESDSNEWTHNFAIIDLAKDDSCNILEGNGDRWVIEFSIIDTNAFLTKGSHNLKLDTYNWDSSLTVFFSNYKTLTPQRYVAEFGSYEILFVDTIAQIVTGRMIARYDAHHYVNGNFTVKYCFWHYP